MLPRRECHVAALRVRWKSEGKVSSQWLSSQRGATQETRGRYNERLKIGMFSRELLGHVGSHLAKRKVTHDGQLATKCALRHGIPCMPPVIKQQQRHLIFLPSFLPSYAIDLRRSNVSAPATPRRGKLCLQAVFELEEVIIMMLVSSEQV